jgi:hypothetical protein
MHLASELTVWVASEQAQAPLAVSRRLGSTISRCAAPVAFVALLAAGLESVRFGMGVPSLIDDWFGITYGGSAFHALLHGDYSSHPVDFAGRYRPAYTALWNYAQWHLFGGPSTSAAAAWGTVRLAAFIVAVWLLARWVVGRSSAVGQAIVWLAPLAVVMTPAIAVDLVRHGPADPIMVAGLILGLTFVGTGLRTLILGPRAGGRKRPVAIIVFGYLLYLIGVYSKETSICLIVFLPFFLKWCWPQARTWIASSRKAPYVLAASAALLAAPLAHVGARLALAVSGGQNPYPNAEFSAGEKISAAVVQPLVGGPAVLGTLAWLIFVPGAVAVAVDLVRRGDRDSWLVFGVLATGFLMSFVALARGETISRYYIPWLVAVAAVALRGLARAKVGFQIAVAVLIVGIALSATRVKIVDWARTEQSGSTAVAMADAVVTAGCPLYLANFDLERRVAIPRLLRFAHSSPLPSCKGSSGRAYALLWSSGPLPSLLVNRCESSWKALEANRGVGLYSCRSFEGGGIADQDAASGDPLTHVVRLRVPTEDPSPRNLFQPRQNAAGS